MQDATGNECKRRKVTASFQGVNEENTENYSQRCMFLANLFRYLRKIYIYKFLGHSVFVACHQEGQYCIMPYYTLPLTCYT